MVNVHTDEGIKGSRKLNEVLRKSTLKEGIFVLLAWNLRNLSENKEIRKGNSYAFSPKDNC